MAMCGVVRAAPAPVSWQRVFAGVVVDGYRDASVAYRSDALTKLAARRG